MSSEAANESVAVREEPYDENGVDRTLIRELLALTPVERLRRVEDAAQGVLLLRELNGVPTVR